MIIIAFLIALAILAQTGHETLAGLLLIGFVGMVLVLNHIKERELRAQDDAHKWGEPKC